MSSLHHGAVDTTYEEIVEALEPYAEYFCQPAPENFLTFANLALFSVIFSVAMLGLAKYCHYQFSKEQAVNKLTLRPLIWALSSLTIVAGR